MSQVCGQRQALGAAGAVRRGKGEWEAQGIGTELTVSHYFLSGSWFCSQGLPSCASFMSLTSWCLSVCT